MAFSSSLPVLLVAVFVGLNEACRNIQPERNCVYWESEGYCSGRGYDDYMKKNCEKACKFCGESGGSSGGSGGGSSGGSGGSYNGECGQPKKQPFSATSSYIVGGKEATPHSIPWQLSVQTTSGFHFCGATILSPNWAVTAAHCVDEGDNIRVVAGAHSKRSGGKKYTVARIYKHKQYNSSNMKNDIAMLQIGGSGMDLSEGSNAMPACLPQKGYEWQTGTQLLVSGWGTLSSGGRSPTNLMQVTVPLVEFSKCARQNGMSSSWRKVLCAGYDAGGKDSCQGDSGGPLIGKVNGKYTLAGVVSWGYGCAKAGYPGVYTHVSHYIDWIKGITG